MSDETVTVRLWQVGGTDKAYLFSPTPQANRQAKPVWIPKSQIEHVSRRPCQLGQWQECEVRMMLWIAQKKGLA